MQSGSNDHLWWNLTKNISGLCKSHSRSAPDVDDLASYFVEKLSLSADFDPSSSTVPSELLEVSYKKSWGVKPSKVRSVMNVAFLMCIAFLKVCSFLDVKKAWFRWYQS